MRAVDNCCFCPSPRATFPHRQTTVSPGLAQQEERPPSAPAHCVLHTEPEGVTVGHPVPSPLSSCFRSPLWMGRRSQSSLTSSTFCLLPIACPTDSPASFCLKTFDLSVLGKTDVPPPSTHTFFSFPFLFLRQSHGVAPTGRELTVVVM